MIDLNLSPRWIKVFNWASWIIALAGTVIGLLADQLVPAATAAMIAGISNLVVQTLQRQVPSVRDMKAPVEEDPDEDDKEDEDGGS
jgi:predicted PurR-regulated permease PerM